jgi:hypothetical protein
VARTPRIPERSEYRAELARLDRPARGRVMRAANLARPAADPHEAGLAAAAASAQRRFWRRWWVAGPVVAGLLQARAGLDVLVANVVMATFVFGGMALFFTWMAGRAERVNRAVVEAAVANAKTARSSKGSQAARNPSSTRRKRKKKKKKKGKR